MTDCGCSPTAAETAAQRRVLWIALALNATMFVVEVTAGWLAHSTALAADGLDMLADASAYAVALMAVGRSLRFKANSAMTSGVLLLLLGIGVLVEVVLRVISGEAPHGAWMIIVAALALIVNAAVLRLLSKQRQEVHIKATQITTTATPKDRLTTVRLPAMLTVRFRPVQQLATSNLMRADRPGRGGSRTSTTSLTYASTTGFM